MEIIDQSSEILWSHNLKDIESAGRVCYQSETKGDPESFIRGLIKKGHESVIEHGSMSVNFITDRGVTHELVRHRLAAYSQESTRYCKYKNGLVIIRPVWLQEDLVGVYDGFLFSWPKKYATWLWIYMMKEIENKYLYLIEDQKWSPQQARSILPNSLKTQIRVTTNYRNWRHIFNLRASKAAHPQIRELMLGLMKKIKENEIVPVIFEDIFEKFKI